jgi:outer membrane lipoprotein SlyB
MEITRGTFIAAIAASALLGGFVAAGVDEAVAKPPSASSIAKTVKKDDLGELREVKSEVESTKKQGK